MSLQARAQRHSGKHRDQIAQGRDGRNDVLLIYVTEMRAGILAEGRRARPGHVLHHDVAGREAAHQHGSLVADHGAKPVLFAKRIGRGAGTGLLPEAEVDTAHDLPLLVEILQRRFHGAVQQHETIDLDGLLAREVSRFANRGRGRGEVAGDFVVEFAISRDLANLEIRVLSTIVRDAVTAQRIRFAFRVSGFARGAEVRTVSVRHALS